MVSIGNGNVNLVEGTDGNSVGSSIESNRKLKVTRLVVVRDTSYIDCDILESILCAEREHAVLRFRDGIVNTVDCITVYTAECYVEGKLGRVYQTNRDGEVTYILANAV